MSLTGDIAAILDTIELPLGTNSLVRRSDALQIWIRRDYANLHQLFVDQPINLLGNSRLEEPLAYRLAWSYWLQGKFERASVYANEVLPFLELAFPPENRGLFYKYHKAAAYEIAGDPRGRALLDELLSDNAGYFNDERFGILHTQFLVMQGNHAEALDEIERLLSQPGLHGPDFFLYLPPYDRLFDEPRFREILRAFYSDEVISQGIAWVRERIAESQAVEVESK